MSYPQEPPKQSGTYIASLKIPFSTGSRIFADAAYFNHDLGVWYKIDAFDNDPALDEDITSFVVGWVNDLGSFGGVVN